MYFDVTEFEGNIYRWGRDESGELIFDKHPTEDYTYLYMIDNTLEEPEAKSLYGDPLRRVFFDNKYEMRQFAERREKYVFESDVHPVYRFIGDNFRNTPQTTYNVSYYDIEVDFNLEDGNGFPTIQDPFGEINSIQCFDSFLQCFVMFIPSVFHGIIHLEAELPVEIIWCDTERDLLKAFAEYLDHVDILTAWFGAGFDLPYIIERACLLFGDETAEKMFCRNGIPAKRRDFVNAYGEEVWDWKLSGRVHLDMMELYKKFKPGERSSFSLDSVCEDELGENKVEFEDDLGSLYRENPQKFYEYGLQDARLLKLLDGKNEIIRLAMAMSHQMCALPTDVTGSVKIIECGLIKHCREKFNMVLPNRDAKLKESFPGALVYETVKGRHGWVFTIDLTGLYPHTMMMLGLSLENFLLQGERGYDDYVAIITKSDEVIKLREVRSGDIISLTGAEAEEVIRENGYTISANCSIFDGSMGVLSDFVETIVETRSVHKKLMKEAKTKEEENLNDLYQKVFKILGNSLYGCITNASFRLFNIDLGKSITLTGQMISKFQATTSNDLINKLKEG